MIALQRPLVGLVAGVSLSETGENESRGFPGREVNRATVQLVGALFGQGVSVVFGHDWREDGVMEAVHSFAREMQPPDPIARDAGPPVLQPLLSNILPWPDQPTLSRDDRERLLSTLRVELPGLPAELAGREAEARAAGPGSDLYRYLHARALTHARKRMNDLCDIRLCVGGATDTSAGRFPGLIEEAYLALSTPKPVYIAGIFGGAARQLIAALRGQPMPADFGRGQTAALFAHPPINECDPASQRDRTASPEAVWSTFVDCSVVGLAAQNLLTPAENNELFDTTSLERIQQLALMGLGRIARARDQAHPR